MIGVFGEWPQTGIVRREDDVARGIPPYVAIGLSAPEVVAGGIDGTEAVGVGPPRPRSPPGWCY